jgi:hypothetical protein
MATWLREHPSFDVGQQWMPSDGYVGTCYAKRSTAPYVDKAPNSLHTKVITSKDFDEILVIQLFLHQD